MTTTLTKGRKPAATSPAAEGMINNATKMFDDFPVGTVSHQGDIIIVSIGFVPAPAEPRTNRQLAEGNTQGSRHVLERGEVFDANRQSVADAINRATKGKATVDPKYIGLVFAGPAYLSHPEHGHQEFPAGCTCAVVYQRKLDAEEREAQVRD